MSKRVNGTLAALGIAALGACAGDDAKCFLKDGDCWGFYGDSITAFGVYPRVVERVFRHFHPDAKVTFVNNGQGGRQAAQATAAGAGVGNPSVVSVMLGMNDAINTEWIKGMPMEPVLERYRANMTKLVHDLKADKREVLLMTPTLTDETFSSTVFRLEGTTELLRRMGKVCEEVAKAEDVPCLPMQDDFERFQDSLPRREQCIRFDGVHPTAAGLYQMARVLWTRLNLAAPLGSGKRSLSAPEPQLPVEASLERRLLPQGSTRLDFLFSSKTPLTAKLTWSANGARGSEDIQIGGRTPWSPKLPASAFPKLAGEASDLVIDLESGGRRAVFFVDISRDALLHMNGGRLSGAIDSPEGARVCDYLFKKEGSTLYFEASVKDAQLVCDRGATAWPWSGDSLTLYLDLRPTPRFGGQALERDVHQVWFQPQDAHGFSPGFRPWYGKGVEHVACPFGEKTADGYKVGLKLDGWRNLQERFDVTSMDFVGFDMAVVDCDAPGGKATWTSLRKTQLQTFLYASCLTVIDLNGKLEGDSLLVANVFPARP